MGSPIPPPSFGPRRAAAAILVFPFPFCAISLPPHSFQLPTFFPYGKVVVLLRKKKKCTREKSSDDSSSPPTSSRPHSYLEKREGEESALFDCTFAGIFFQLRLPTSRPKESGSSLPPFQFNPPLANISNPPPFPPVVFSIPEAADFPSSPYRTLAFVLKTNKRERRFRIHHHHPLPTTTTTPPAPPSVPPSRPPLLFWGRESEVNRKDFPFPFPRFPFLAHRLVFASAFARKRGV